MLRSSHPATRFTWPVALSITSGDVVRMRYLRTSSYTKINIWKEKTGDEDEGRGGGAGWRRISRRARGRQGREKPDTRYRYMCSTPS